MKKMILFVGAFCAAAAGFLVWGTKSVEPVEKLAEQLEHAWSDHHTTV